MSQVHPMHPDLSMAQLHHFILVADLKSFHAAAEQAFRTQPAISLSVKELERRLGEPLFEKNRKVELTPYGERCLPLARALVDHYQQVSGEMLRLANCEEGAVSVAAVPSVASRLLPGILAEFAGNHPEIRLTVKDGSAREVQGMVSRREADFGICSLWEDDPSLSFTPLLRDSIGVVCRGDHRLAGLGRALVWNDLQGERLIENGTTRLLDNPQAQAAIAESHFAVSNMISLIAMLEAGLGITTLPRLAFPGDNESLVFLTLDEPAVERCIGILTPRDRSLTPAAASLLQTTRDQLVSATAAI